MSSPFDRFLVPETAAMPPEVAAANEALKAAGGEFARARDAWKEARRKADQAPRRDAAAADAALEAGRRAPRTTAADAERAAEDARAAMEAAKRFGDAKARELADTIEKARPAWLKREQASMRDAIEEVSAAVDALEAIFQRLGERATIVSTLTTYDPRTRHGRIFWQMVDETVFAGSSSHGRELLVKERPSDLLPALRRAAARTAEQAGETYFVSPEQIAATLANRRREVALGSGSPAAA